MEKKTDYRGLRTLLNRYLFSRGKLLFHQAELALREKEIIEYLKQEGIEDATTIVQNEKVIVKNSVQHNHIIKDDAAAIIRRSIPAEYFPLVLHEKEFVDIDVLVKLVNGGKVSADILKIIRTTETVTNFSVTVIS